MEEKKRQIYLPPIYINKTGRDKVGVREKGQSGKMGGVGGALLCQRAWLSLNLTWILEAEKLWILIQVKSSQQVKRANDIKTELNSHF